MTFISKRHEHDASYFWSRPRCLTLVLIGCFFGAILTAVVLWCVRDHVAEDEAALPSLPEAATSRELDEATREALVVLDGASMVQCGAGALGSFFVIYTISEEYPARSAIEEISSRLGALGWVPLKEDWLNPGLPSSHVRGWTDYRNETRNPPAYTHQWSAQWQDRFGNVVAYTLQYEYRVGERPDLHSLWVNASWFPVASVGTMRSTGREEIPREGILERIQKWAAGLGRENE